METAFWKGRVYWDYGRERWEGEHEAPPNSPKNNLLLWMNTLSQSNFSSVEVCVEDGGMLSDSREHLSCLEFSFLSPACVITGEGLFFGVCRGKHRVSAFWVIKHRPLSPSSYIPNSFSGLSGQPERFQHPNLFDFFFPLSADPARTYLNFSWIYLALVLMCMLLHIYLFFPSPSRKTM